VKYLHIVLVSVAMSLLLVGCSGNDEGENGQVPPPTGTPGPPPTVTPPTVIPVAGMDFLTLVQQLLASTAENTDPVPVHTATFTNLLADGDPQPVTFFRP
jgi:hypothetical protein